MTKTLFRAAALPLIATIALQSCTVSEPDTPSGDASSLLLKQVTCFGIAVMDFDYDNQNRITRIEFGNESSYELTYESGSTRVPSKIISSEYEDFEVNDKPESAITERNIYTNIRANSAGMITSATVNTTYWDYDIVYADDDMSKEVLKVTREYSDSPDHETWSYDSNGRLLSNTTVSTDLSGHTITDVITYTWKNGNLVSATDHEYENGFWEYSDVDNTTGQWDPNNQIIGPLAVTGLFGKAPAKFTKSCTRTETGNHPSSEAYQYAYALLDNGLINLANIYDSTEHVSMVLKFVYTEAK